MADNHDVIKRYDVAHLASTGKVNLSVRTTGKGEP